MAKGRRGSAREQLTRRVRKWLEKLLRSGGSNGVYARDVFAAADKVGLTHGTVNRVSKLMKVYKRNDGYQGKSVWRLPQAMLDGGDAKSAPGSFAAAMLRNVDDALMLLVDSLVRKGEYERLVMVIVDSGDVKSGVMILKRVAEIAKGGK